MTPGFQCSSASRKFLNGPAFRAGAARFVVSVLFSEPKIPQLSLQASEKVVVKSFSALQRAENSSMLRCTSPIRLTHTFQCSSASRKFLNRPLGASHRTQRSSFSALQRAENSSIQSQSSCVYDRPAVSVLFSEPKIPQSQLVEEYRADPSLFQCSSASRKFLNR